MDCCQAICQQTKSLIWVFGQDLFWRSRPSLDQGFTREATHCVIARETADEVSYQAKVGSGERYFSQSLNFAPLHACSILIADEADGIDGQKIMI